MYLTGYENNLYDFSKFKSVEYIKVYFQHMFYAHFPFFIQLYYNIVIELVNVRMHIKYYANFVVIITYIQLST